MGGGNHQEHSSDLNDVPARGTALAKRGSDSMPQRNIIKISWRKKGNLTDHTVARNQKGERGNVSVNYEFIQGVGGRRREKKGSTEFRKSSKDETLGGID